MLSSTSELSHCQQHIIEAEDADDLIQEVYNPMETADVQISVITDPNFESETATPIIGTYETIANASSPVCSDTLISSGTDTPVDESSRDTIPDLPADVTHRNVSTQDLSQRKLVRNLKR